MLVGSTAVVVKSDITLLQSTEANAGKSTIEILLRFWLL